MKFMLLIYNNPAALPAGELEAIGRDVDTLIEELQGSGELIGGDGLADSSLAKTVRVRDGETATTDGPFLEAKEQLAGYLMVDVESLARATEIAARWPDARHGAMEVRAVMSAGAEDV
jgi:hypothetical protein